jgi:hypothetical protein
MIDASFNFLPTRPAEEIVAEYIRTVDYLYEPTKYLVRTYRYFLAMRPTRAATAGKSRGRSAGNQKGRLPFWARRNDLAAFLKLVWRQGIVAGYRLQFWRQLVGIYRNNPTRLTKYLVKCGVGEDLFKIRARLLEKTGPVRAEQNAASLTGRPGC